MRPCQNYSTTCYYYMHVHVHVFMNITHIIMFPRVFLFCLPKTIDYNLTSPNSYQH